jgi:hypothetical protein
MISIIMVIAAASAFSQDTAKPSEAAKAAVAEPAAAPQAKEIAIYGEVQAVNAIANTLSVQYYDYDSDSEKTAEVAVAAETKMENAKSASDVKKGDWVDVTYVVSGQKNIAKTVSVEKEEPAAEPTAGAGATAGASSDE